MIVDLMTWARVPYLRATWTHQELPIIIERTEINDTIVGRGIVAHNHRTIATVDWSSVHQTARIFRAESSYKYRCSSSSK